MHVSYQRALSREPFITGAELYRPGFRVRVVNESELSGRSCSRSLCQATSVMTRNQLQYISWIVATDALKVSLTRFSEMLCVKLKEEKLVSFCIDKLLFSAKFWAFRIDTLESSILVT